MLSVVLLAACVGGQQSKPGTKAIAVLQPLNASSVQGVVKFEQLESAVKVTARFEGLNPSSKHGFHIHEFGDLLDQSGKGAGGHYNPDGHNHSLPTGGQRHMGDLGNISSDSNGRALFSITINDLSIAGGHHNIIGRSVIVHAKADDGTGASGNAGKRIAGAVIGYQSAK